MGLIILNIYRRYRETKAFLIQLTKYPFSNCFAMLMLIQFFRLLKQSQLDLILLNLAILLFSLVRESSRSYSLRFVCPNQQQEPEQQALYLYFKERCHLFIVFHFAESSQHSKKQHLNYINLIKAFKNTSGSKGNINSQIRNRNKILYLCFYCLWYENQSFVYKIKFGLLFMWFLKSKEQEEWSNAWRTYYNIRAALALVLSEKIKAKYSQKMIRQFLETKGINSKMYEQITKISKTIPKDDIRYTLANL